MALNRTDRLAKLDETYNKTGQVKIPVSKQYKILKTVAIVTFCCSLLFFLGSLVGQYLVLHGDNVAKVGGADGPKNIVITSTPIAWYTFLQNIGIYLVILSAIVVFAYFFIQVRETKPKNTTPTL